MGECDVFCHDRAGERGLFLVEGVHRDVDACEDERFDTFHGVVEGGGEQLALFVGEFAEHIVYLSAFRKLAADAYPQARVLLSDELLDVSEAVVSAVGAAAFQAYLAEREGEFVNDDEQTLVGDVLFLEPVSDGDSAFCALHAKTAENRRRRRGSCMSSA